MQHTRLSGVIVLATGVATVTLLLLLLYSYTTARIDFEQAMLAALVITLPIACIGVFRPFDSARVRRQLYSESNG